jgi:2-polyprenyl-3-methyl-5-hydroxy-6-metoxy-1,4-benzoquinol methylase
MKDLLHMNPNVEKLLERHCPICGHPTGRFLFHQSFELMKTTTFSQVSNYDVVNCLKCGFVFADISDKYSFEKNYSNYYKKTDKYVGPKATGSGVSEWDAARFKAMANDIDLLLCRNKELQILDIGCGSGGLLLALKALGYRNLYGVDISEDCIETIRRNGICGAEANFSIDDFAKKEFVARGFDCVILSHVMEHVFALDRAVKNASSCLNEKGILYVEVPDATRYQNYFSVPFHSFDLEHINHFDLTALNNLMENCGFANVGHQSKDVPLTRQFRIPAFYALYRKVFNRQHSVQLKMCTLLVESIEKYIERSAKSNIWPAIAKYAENKERIVVWGADWFASWLLSNTPLNNCNIDFFVDNDKNKQGHSICGREILPISALTNCQDTIIVCSAFHTESIIKEIEEKQIKNKVVCIV